MYRLWGMLPVGNFAPDPGTGCFFMDSLCCFTAPPFTSGVHFAYTLQWTRFARLQY
jgi:hypothetical protein